MEHIENELMQEVSSLEEVEAGIDSIESIGNEIFAEVKTAVDASAVINEAIELSEQDYADIQELFCKYGNDCANSLITFKEMPRDIRVDYNYPYLRIGTIGDNFWQGHCSKYERVFEFDIDELGSLNEFKLDKVGYDDYVRISINGEQVFNAPFGGDKLEVVNHRVITGDGKKHRCELAINRANSLDIDLKPYLNTGSNEIRIETVVGNAGESWLRIKAS